jgi:hypothetical protein
MDKVLRVRQADDLHDYQVVVDSVGGESSFDTITVIFESPAEEDVVHFARGLQWAMENGNARLKDVTFDLGEYA